MKYIVAFDVFKKQHILDIFNKIKKKFRLNIIFTDDKIRHYNGTMNDSNITYTSNLSFNTEILTEYFIEDIRIKCKNINFTCSPYDFYIQNKKIINKEYLFLLKKLKVKKSEKKKKYFLFKNLIKRKLKRDCDTFPIFVILSIYCTFKPRDVLDMSSGWGDRLMGAMIYNNCNYTGVDPNSMLHPRYIKMIETFRTKSEHKYEMLESSFENVILKKKYDLMFSCPPYFITEEYSDDKNQSFLKYSNNLDMWLSKFMYKSIDKIWTHLKTGGFLVIVINDTRIKNKIIFYTQRIINYILKKKGSKFINMLKYKTDNTIQPIWCFQKIFPIKKTIFDKPFYINTFTQNNRKFNVIREDFLIGGSKQRIMSDIISSIKNKNLFYRGHVNGYAQLALAYGCFIKDKQCHLILNKQPNKELYIITKISKIFGAIIHEIDKPINDKDEENKINNILNKYSDTYVFPLGFHSKKAIKIYKKVLVKLKKNIGDIKRLWIVASSGIIVDSLMEIFKKTFFNVVFIGHVPDDYFLNKRIKVYKAPQYFREHTSIVSPYRSELSFDGKIWQFIIKDGIDNDFIFNVGGLF